MATYLLSNGEDFVGLEVDSEYYIKEGNITVGTSFVLNGSGKTPSQIDQVEADGAQLQVVDTGTSTTVYDNLGNNYALCIGGRPRHRPRT